MSSTTPTIRFVVQDPPARAQSIEDEVLGNIRAQPIGPATVGDLNLPEPFLRRFADRIVRSSFEDNFRVVIADEPEPDASATAPPPASTTAPPLGGAAQETTPGPGSSGPAVGLVVAGVLLVLGFVFLVRRRRA